MNTLPKTKRKHPFHAFVCVLGALFTGLSVTLSACDTSEHDIEPPVSVLFDTPWNAGLDPDEPSFHVQQIDADTLAIRQSIKSSLEAPFLYLIFGREKALLIDTGVEGVDLRAEIDRQIADWLEANGQASVSLVVMHSHGHGDHVGGDAALAQRPDTAIVGHKQEDVAQFFGIENWPIQDMTFDLGGRIVDILATPGHHPSHVMVFDRDTKILFTGDSVYPGRLLFQCDKLKEFAASIDRVAAFAKENDVAWLLGGHVEIKARPGELFKLRNGDDRRRYEHVLELPPSILDEIKAGLTQLAGRLVVTPYDEFVLFPHPANPRGRRPPNWCLAKTTSE